MPEAGSYEVTNFGWFGGSETDFVGGSPDAPGGLATVFTAEAALNIGDNVYLSAAHSVNKSTTQSLYQGVVGIVIGGTATGMKVMQDDNMIGLAAAAAGELVIVCIQGKCKGVADGAITLGTPVTADNTTAGRLETATLTTEAAAGDTGLITGVALETTTTAGNKFLVLVNPR